MWLVEEFRKVEVFAWSNGSSQSAYFPSTDVKIARVKWTLALTHVSKMVQVTGMFSSFHQTQLTLFSPIVCVCVCVYISTDMTMCFECWPLCLEIAISSLLRHILEFPQRGWWLGAIKGSALSGLDQQPSSHDTWPRAHPVVRPQCCAVKGQDLFMRDK